MVVSPVTAVSIDAAPQPVRVASVELLIVILAGRFGRLSVIEKLVSEVSAGALISILSLELPPALIVVGENDLVPVTPVPVAYTLTLAVAATTLLTP